jgi:DNA helicase-2/ATP-dependent DNA helicase PcrA
LVNLVSQRFPTIERHEQIPIPDSLIKEVLPQGDFHLQEERRLFYVGMTRAKEKLILTAADYYGEGKREKNFSRSFSKRWGIEQVVKSQKLEEQLSLDYEPKAKSSEVSTKEDKLLSTSIIYPILKLKLSKSVLCILNSNIFCEFRLLHQQPKVSEPQFIQRSKIFIRPSNDQPHLRQGFAGSLRKLLFELLENNWVKEGYTSKKHETMFSDKGKFISIRLSKRRFRPKLPPALMEQKFILPLNPTSHEASRDFARSKLAA